MDIEEVKKLKLEPNDVLYVKLNMKNMPPSKYQEYIVTVKTSLEGIFPNNIILITDETTDISVIKPV